MPVGFADKTKLSYLEAREFAGLEQQLIRAEETLQAKHANLAESRHRQRWSGPSCRLSRS